MARRKELEGIGFGVEGNEDVIGETQGKKRKSEEGLGN